MITALAFDYFAEQDVDFAVIETGLGGRLDSTNVVEPEVACLTSISLDHTAQLGPTLDKIATEKAGILKPGAAAVSGPQHPEVEAALRRIAEEKGVDLRLLGDEIDFSVRFEASRSGGRNNRMTPVFRITRGSRPLNIAADGCRVLFGEYGDGFDSSGACIYVSEDFGRSFHVGYRFAPGEIRHIHNILVDPYGDHYWVLVGDFGRQPGIGVLSKDMKNIDWVCRGSQQCRAVGAVIEEDGLVYGTDSDRERNFIVRLDRKSGQLKKLREVEGSSLYAARFGAVRVISTCVEPNPKCPSRDCSLYASLDGIDWQRVAVRVKDPFHSVFFQFGTFVLPYAYNGTNSGMYSGQALRGMDDYVVLADFRDLQGCRNAE